jgi:DNA-binding transcriptional ArsR family regulator
VDDIGPLPRLLAAAHDVTGAAGAGAAEELVRWTRAWLVAWQGVLHAAGVIGSEAPWTVPVRLGDVPTLKADPERRRRDAALALLERATLLERVAHPDGEQGTLGEALFVTHRAGLEVDWGAACRACRHEPAALLVLRALSELVSPLDTLTPVSLRELAARTGYGEKQVRVALRRLTDDGVIEAAEAAGQPARYRLSELARGRGGRPAPLPAPAPVHTQPGPAEPTPAPGSPASPPAPAAVASAVRLTLNGVTVSLGAGVTAHVAYDADGVPHLTIPPPVGPTG